MCPHYKYPKISKMQGELIFCLEKNVIEREREGKEKQPFSDDFTGFCRSELDRTRVKLSCSTRRELRVGTEITRFCQGLGFHGN